LALNLNHTEGGRGRVFDVEQEKLRYTLGGKRRKDLRHTARDRETTHSGHFISSLRPKERERKHGRVTGRIGGSICVIHNE